MGEAFVSLVVREQQIYSAALLFVVVLVENSLRMSLAISTSLRVMPRARITLGLEKPSLHNLTTKRKEISMKRGHFELLA